MRCSPRRELCRQHTHESLRQTRVSIYGEKFESIRNITCFGIVKSHRSVPMLGRDEMFRVRLLLAERLVKSSNTTDDTNCHEAE